MLEGKSVIVTGGGNGLGQAFSRALAASGGAVVVNDIDSGAAETTAREIREAGGTATAHVGDIVDPSYTDELIGDCVKSFGKVDVVVNNAGLYWVIPLWEETEENLRKIVDVNIFGTYNVARSVVDHMKERRQGSIINVISGAQSGIWGSSLYGGTKGAVSSFTYTWAMELAPFNVRVNAISPLGSTRRSRIAVRHSYTPADNAPMVVFLASEAAANVTGQILRTAGNTLSLFSHPKPTRHVVAKDGWTPELMAEVFQSTIGQALEPVGVNATHYLYDDGLENAPSLEPPPL